MAPRLACKGMLLVQLRRLMPRFELCMRPSERARQERKCTQLLGEDVWGYTGRASRAYPAVAPTFRPLPQATVHISPTPPPHTLRRVSETTTATLAVTRAHVAAQFDHVAANAPSHLCPAPTCPTCPTKAEIASSPTPPGPSCASINVTYHATHYKPKASPCAAAPCCASFPTTRLDPVPRRHTPSALLDTSVTSVNGQLGARRVL